MTLTLESVLLILLFVALIGGFAWFLMWIIPMSPKMKQVLTAAAIIGAVLVILIGFGILPRLLHLHVGG